MLRGDWCYISDVVSSGEAPLHSREEQTTLRWMRFLLMVEPTTSRDLSWLLATSIRGISPLTARETAKTRVTGGGQHERVQDEGSLGNWSLADYTHPPIIAHSPLCGHAMPAHVSDTLPLFHPSISDDCGAGVISFSRPRALRIVSTIHIHGLHRVSFSFESPTWILVFTCSTGRNNNDGQRLLLPAHERR